MQRPEFVRLTKQVKGGHEDVGYSYVIVRRGQRPGVPAEVSPGLEENPLSYPDTLTEDQFRDAAYSWPRIVFPPLKRSGHIILDSCTADGRVSPIVPGSGFMFMFFFRKNNEDHHPQIARKTAFL